MTEEINQIKWRCRRGMLELDMFLMPFCENSYVTLTTSQKHIFLELLEEEDVYLLHWLMGAGESDEPKFKPLIALIRNYHLDSYVGC